jgi:hypothetical protein
MSAATKKRGRGRPPKPPEERADVTLHVRFTAGEIDTLDRHIEGQRQSAPTGTTITRSSLVRALVLREIGLTDDAGGPSAAPKKRPASTAKKRPASTAQRGGKRAARKPKSKK